MGAADGAENRSALPHQWGQIPASAGKRCRVGFATYDCATGAPLESGQISKLNLPPDGRNAIPAARNWYLFELSSDDRKAIQEVSLQHLDTIPQSGVRRRRIWDDPTIPRDDVRLINSHYDDLYRVLNHGVIQVDRSDGSSYTARVEHLDDYHFDLASTETSITSVSSAR